MAEDKYARIRLDSQLCFPLYACSRKIVQQYTPLLDELGITYTQYLTLMVLWEEGEATVGELTKKLYLDTGTMTPLLKKMQTKGLITRERSKEDERSVIIKLTPEGDALKDKAVAIPGHMIQCLNLSKGEFDVLYKALYKLLDNLKH